MAINPIRRSIIEKAKSSIFKGKAEEKKRLAEEAGSSGFSERQFEERLKKEGYDPKKRKTIINETLGDKKDPEQIKRNVRRTMERDFSALEEDKQRVKRGILALGGEKGTAENRFGIKRPSVGFAGQTNKTSPPPPSRTGGSAPRIPLSR